MIIYKATNKINKKVYIGQTIQQLRDRMQNHKDDSKTKNTYFCNALRKYGYNEFIWEEIDIAISLEELDFLETVWINLFISNNRKYGYNSTTGGKQARHNKETINKLKERYASGELVPWSKGKTLLQETKNKMSKFQKDKIVSEKTKQKMRDNHANVNGENNPRFGQSNYDVWLEKYGKEIADQKMREYKQKCSQKYSGDGNPMYGRVRSDISRKVLCIDTNIEYISISEAAKLTNLHISGITMACKGKLKTSGGYKWKYIDN